MGCHPDHAAVGDDVSSVELTKINIFVKFELSIFTIY